MKRLKRFLKQLINFLPVNCSDMKQLYIDIVSARDENKIHTLMYLLNVMTKIDELYTVIINSEIKYPEENTDMHLFCLGICYKYKTEFDYDKMIKCFTKSEKLMNSYAMVALGDSYYNEIANEKIKLLELIIKIEQNLNEKNNIN